MIQNVVIEGFKSIERVELDLGRVNVFIGENGGGKSNLLEGIAIGAAAAAGMLKNEFLAARGIRVTEAAFMKPAFKAQTAAMKFSLHVDDLEPFAVEVDFAAPQSTRTSPSLGSQQLDALMQVLTTRWPDQEVPLEQLYSDESIPPELRHALRATAKRGEFVSDVLSGFLIYSPENSALRTFEREGQILPLGVNGEGLFAHLKRLSATPDGQAVLQVIIEQLSLISWFERFELPTDLGFGERRLHIRDRYLAEGALFDQRSANEGFLLLLFYMTLFLSPATPRFFAIDNVDASLNPKLCKQLMQTLATIAKDKDKQALLTTHNPALLDGLNLHDAEQRLFVVERDGDGRTRVRRVEAPRERAGRAPVPLSDAFIKGYLGGLPKNF